MGSKRKHQARRVASPTAISGMNMLSIPAAWSDPLDAWETELRGIGRPRTTRYTRLYHLRRFAADVRGTPWTITRADIVAWLADRDWAPQTRRSNRASLTQFYRWAHQTGRIDADPTAMVPAVRIPRSRPRPAPDSAVRQGLATHDERTRMIIAILVCTGMRRAEVAAMHSDDLERAVDGWQLRVIGKGGHERVVPIPDELASMIRQRGSGWVFPGQIDGHLSPAYLGKLVSRAMPDGWTAHTLRHRYATLAYADSRDLRAVQELLGHASIATTQVYTDVPPSRLRAAAVAALPAA